MTRPAQITQLLLHVPRKLLYGSVVAKGTLWRVLGEPDWQQHRAALSGSSAAGAPQPGTSAAAVTVLAVALTAAAAVAAVKTS